MIRGETIVPKVAIWLGNRSRKIKGLHDAGGDDGGGGNAAQRGVMGGGYSPAINELGMF